MSHGKYTTGPVKRINAISEKSKPILARMNVNAEDSTPTRFTPVLVSDCIPFAVVIPRHTPTPNELAIDELTVLYLQAAINIFHKGQDKILKNTFIKRMCSTYSCVSIHAKKLPCVRSDTIGVKREDFKKMFYDYGPLRNEYASESMANPKRWDDNGMKISEIVQLCQGVYWKENMSSDDYEDCISNAKYRAVYARFSTHRPGDTVNGEAESIGGQRALVVSHRMPKTRSTRFGTKTVAEVKNIKYQRVRGCWMVTDDTSIRYYGTIAQVLRQYSLAVNLPLAQKESEQDEWMRLAEEMCK